MTLFKIEDKDPKQPYLGIGIIILCVVFFFIGVFHGKKESLRTVGSLSPEYSAAKVLILRNRLNVITRELKSFNKPTRDDLVGYIFELKSIADK
jgi:hypothetical protein